MGSRRSAVAAILLLAAVPVLGPAAVPRALSQEPSVLWITGARERPFSFPCDVAVDRRGVAFLLDSGNRRISLFSPGGEFVRDVGGAGWRDPMAVAVGDDGSIFVADGDSGRILEMDLSGAVRHQYSGGKGARMTGVGVYGEQVFAVDNGNARIVVFRRGGGQTGAWGRKGDGPGEFHAPFRIAVDPSGRVFVTDVLNGRIQWFSAFGRHLGTLKRFGAAAGRIFRPTGVALDPRGRIWVTDSFTGLVQLFDEKGGFVQALGSERGRPMVFGDPVAVREGPTGVWVADQREHRAALVRK